MSSDESGEEKEGVEGAEDVEGRGAENAAAKDDMETNGKYVESQSVFGVEF